LDERTIPTAVAFSMVPTRLMPHKNVPSIPETRPKGWIFYATGYFTLIEHKDVRTVVTVAAFSMVPTRLIPHRNVPSIPKMTQDKRVLNNLLTVV
jgi:hypothetical protein